MACARNTGALRLMSRWVSQDQTRRRPECRTARGNQLVQAGKIAKVGLQDCGLASCVFDFGQQRLGIGLRIAVVDGDRPTVTGHIERNGPSDTPGSTGNQHGSTRRGGRSTHFRVL